MRRVLRWIGILLGGLIVLVVATAGVLYGLAASRLGRTYAMAPEAVAIPAGAEAVERGRHWARVLCADCHGETFAGRVMFEDPAVGRIAAGNLTTGDGGLAAFTDADWVRAIRHGVGPDGKPLMIMPAEEYYYLSDGDLGAIIAFLKSLPPASGPRGGYTVTPTARVLFGLGVFGTLPAEIVNHTAPRPATPPPGPTAEYGAYLTAISGCRTCHGQDLAGGKGPQPGASPAPDLTPGGMLSKGTAEGFITGMRTGKAPDGDEMSDEMPWKFYGRMSDDELRAMWLYLIQLPTRTAPGK